jgi:membrane protease YdiL (CAAX protease family)
MTERAPPALIVLGLLAVWNVLINLVVPAPLYVPANLAMTATLLSLGRRWGFDRGDVGLAGSGVRPGIRLGLVVATSIAIASIGLVSWEWSRRFFEDGTLVDLAVVGMLYQVVIRIPLGTALFEEVAFRGVLFATLARGGSTPTAAVVSSVAFGFWHVLPTLGRLDLNPAGGYAVNGLAEVGLVALFVVVTAAAGLGFVWLRRRSGSLLAPIVAHAGINCSAFLLGWLVAR